MSDILKRKCLNFVPQREIHPLKPTSESKTLTGVCGVGVCVCGGGVVPSL